MNPLLSMFRVAVRWWLVLIISVIAMQCNVFRLAETPSRPAPAPTRPLAKEETLRRDIVQYAKQYTGKSYQAAGKTPATGFDCSGFTSYVLRHYDIKLSASADQQSRQGAEKPVKQAHAGDLVFFRRGPGQPVFHVAMVVDHSANSLKVIHSTSSRGVIVEDVLNSAYWKPKIDAVRDVVSVRSLQSAVFSPHGSIISLTPLLN